MVTFDRWQSFDIQQELQAVGIRTDTVSVAKKHYEDLAMMVYEERIVMPHIPLLLEEMSELKIINDKKVDHPRKKSKDLADAVTGAVFGALSHTPKNPNIEIEIHTWASSTLKNDKAGQDVVELSNRKIPDNVRDYLDQLKII